MTAEYPPFPLIPCIAFNTSAPSGTTAMPRQCVVGPLAFSIAQDLSFGSYCGFELVADGSHTPTFPGMTEASFSLNWSNRTGVLHSMSLYYGAQDSGPSYSIDVIGPTPIPAVTSLAVAHGENPVVEIGIGGASLSTAFVPAPTQFSISRAPTLLNGSTLAVTSVAVSANQIALTLSGTISLGDVVTLSYAPPYPGQPAYPVAAQDGSGNLLAGFTGTVTVS